MMTLEIIKDLAVAALLVLLGWVSSRVRFWWKFARFLKAFGSSAQSLGNVMICLPLWKVVPAPRDVKQFKKAGPDGREYAYFGPDDMLAKGDVDAAEAVSVLFGQFFSQPVRLLLDTEDVDLEGKCVVLIASPIANLRMRYLLADHPHPYFEFRETEETEEHPAAQLLYDKQEGTVYDSAGDREYSLVMRMPNPHSPRTAFFYLGAGGHVTGTLAAAKYLLKHWRRFARSKDPHAAVLLGMRRGDPPSRRVIKEYGLPG